MKWVMKRCAFMVAVLCMATGTASALSITDAFTDIVGQGLDPGNFAVVDEHGGPSAVWATIDEDIGLAFTFDFPNANELKVTITNTSSHTMFDTMLAFEQNALDWKGTVLAAASWDGVDNTNDAAFVFGDIAALGGTSMRTIALKAGHTSPTLLFDSFGLDSTLTTNPGSSNLSVTHGIPEPGTLALLGVGLIGLARVTKKRLQRKV